MSASKQDFTNYAWHIGDVTNRYLMNLKRVEEMVYNGNHLKAMEFMRNLFRSCSDPPTESGGVELENMGITCSPVRSALVFALAAVKHAKMSEATSKQKEMSDGPKWCLKNIFDLVKAVHHIDRASSATRGKDVMIFMVAMMIATYEKIDLFVNPKSNHEIVTSAKVASFIAIACNFVTDKENALFFSTRAVNLIQNPKVIVDKGMSARTYQTAGVCFRNMGEEEKAIEYLRKAETLANKMDDTVKNTAKEELLKYIKRDLSSGSAKYPTQD